METRIIDRSLIQKIVPLLHELNPNITLDNLLKLQLEMFEISTFTCFGLFDESTLIGVASGWVTVRLYSGKQLEIDNVIISSTYRSKGVGAMFITDIEQWALENSCKTIELNTYVVNGKSHKFYFNQGLC